VSFEFNYLGGNAVGFNDPVDGATFRAALESAASRLGNELLHDAEVQIDVTSSSFNGTGVASARSALPPSPPDGGFLDTIVAAKVKGLGDANSAAADGQLQVFFFGPSDPFTYVTDPAQVDADNEIDFQAVAIHELAHTLGFTSATTASGSDDFGGGIDSPGTWRPFDQFLSDAAGNRLIDANPQSSTAYRMNSGENGWSTHSVGGKGPDAGLFFDGPVATAVYGARVPLYSPATFSLISSVGHLDSEGALDDDPIFSPLTHLMSHATIDRAVPQEFTLVEKAIFADMGIMFREDTVPDITAPADILLEGNSDGGFSGSNADLNNFLSGAVASDLFDANVAITHDAPSFLPLGQNTIVFTATDDSGNQSTASAIITVIDTTAPTISASPMFTTFEATGPSGVSGVTLPFDISSTDLVDPNPIVSFTPGSDFPLGTTTLTISSEDAVGNASTLTVDVIVQDTTPPEFTLPATLTISSNLPTGADLSNPRLVDLLATSATDSVDPTLTFTSSPATIPLGITSVTITATDDSGNATSRVTAVTVTDSSFTVTTLDDELDVDPASDPADLSLREAISLADASAGLDAIFFDSSLNGSILLDSSADALQVTDSVSIIGPGSAVITIDAQGNSRVMDFTTNSGDVVIEGLTITGGMAVGEDETGGGIRFQSQGTLTVNDSVVTGNATMGLTANGGGIHVSDGNLVLTGSTVSDNATGGESSGGGGVWAGGDVTITHSTVIGNHTRADSSLGGGLVVLNGTTSITRSTVAGNFTEGLGSGGGGVVLQSNSAVIRDSTISGNFTDNADAHGGGIHAALANVDVINSTLSGNRVGSDTNSSDGGGIYASGGTLDIDNSTITSNQATGVGGGVGIPADGGTTTLTIENSIVAGNLDDGTAPDFVGLGAISSPGAVRFSLIGDRTGTTLNASPTADPASGNVVGDSAGSGAIDPQLAPLGDNGGATQTHVPQSGSPAIDGGDRLFNRDVFTPPLAGDQRGVRFPRISGDAIDMGALETIGSVTIVWNNPGDIVFGTPLSSAELNATTEVAGTFIYTPAVGTFLGAGDAQPLSVEFTPDDSNAFAVTTATVFIDVLRADPVITWPMPESILFGTSLSETELNATANVAGSFEYAPALGTILDAGNDHVLSVTFTPTDSQNFSTVTDSVLIDVLPAAPEISWSDPDPIVFGTRLSSTQLNATANVPGTFSYVPPLGILMQAGQDQTLSVMFTPEDLINYSPVSATVEIDVMKADPIIVWNNPSDIVVGTPLSEAQLNASSPNLGSFVFNPAAGTVLEVGSQQNLSATFIPTNSGNINSVTVTVAINVIDVQDFGDAPDSYPVTLADNGARHETTTLMLGADVDDDLNGQPSPGADGDGADDDGIQTIADLVVVADSGTTASVIANASEAGKLDGWIDFNQDGDWDDDGEQIIVSRDVVAGDNPISYSIPAAAVSGQTAARFRISTAGGLAATGPASDGEVEDYLVTLLDGGQSPAVTVHGINTQTTLSVDSDSIAVSSSGTDLFAAPAANVGRLSVVGSLLDEVITLQLSAGAATPANGLDLQGGLGRDSLALAGEGGSVDFTDPSIVVANFRTMDLASHDATTVAIDAATVSSMSPIDKEITIIAGGEDELVVVDAADWLMTHPISINGRFIRTATNQSGSAEIIQVESPSHWQNFLQHGDVNNDGAVTAVDALRIINELGRRTFSDPQTRVLRDAITVLPFPGNYFDHNGDGRASALDALRVINDLARQSLGNTSAAAEQLTTDVGSATSAASRLPVIGGEQPGQAMSQPNVTEDSGGETADTSTPARRSAFSPASDHVTSARSFASDWVETSSHTDSSSHSTKSNVDDLLADTEFLDGLLL
jgi:hypothetical protein